MPTKDYADTPTATAAGAQMMTAARRPRKEPLNTHELQAIHSLCAWVAAEQEVPQEAVRSLAGARFGSNDVGSLQRKDYDDVIRFLVDLRIDQIFS